jgi:hypothetical protein
MREIGSVLTWTPDLLGSTTNPTVSYFQRVGRVIRIGQNLLAVNLYMVVNTGWTAGTGNVLLSAPVIAGGFTPVAGNTNTQAMAGMCLVNDSLQADKFMFDNTNRIIPCKSNGNILTWADLTSTGLQIQITFNYLIHI